MHDTNTTAIPATPDRHCNGCAVEHTATESNSMGKCKTVCGDIPGGACGNTADADRRNAIHREKILMLASLYAIKFRDHDYTIEVSDAWEQFAAAVDELVAGK